LVKDAYHLAGIELPEIIRGDIDDDAKLERIPAGMEEHFFKISDIDFVEVGDVIVTALGGKASHMAIYIGEGRVLHHQYNQMSLRENLSEGWLKRIHSIWRHPDWKTECFEALEQDFGW
jgi:cell wall-associated NlpC family hydrolase